MMTFLSNAWPWLLVAVLALTTTVSYIGLARYFVGYCIREMERSRGAVERLDAERERRADVERALTQLTRDRNEAVSKAHGLQQFCDQLTRERNDAVDRMNRVDNDFRRVSAELADLQQLSPRARAQRSRKGTR